MWPGDGDDDGDRKRLVGSKSLDEFRNRLKQSFGTAIKAEHPFDEPKECLICTNKIKVAALLSRKCLKSLHPCSGAACSCADRALICWDCYSETLWKSPRSQPSLGRFRATCPACGGEFCHYDIVELQGAVPVEFTRPVVTRHVMARVGLQSEKIRVQEWLQRRHENAQGGAPAAGVEAVVRRFFVDTERQEMPLPNLSGAERAIAHKVAEDLGLEHVSKGEGAKRCLWIKKRGKQDEPKECEDLLIWKAYIALQGNTVEFYAHEYLSRVDKDWQAMRRDRDGLEHHITVVSRAELENLALKLNGVKKIEKSFVSDLLWQFVCSVKNDWTVVGLGGISEMANQVRYVIVQWPSANLWRESVGLRSADFHITLGFSKSDVHDVVKDKTTLMPE